MTARSQLLIKLGFLLALIATCGSLIFSDVLGYPPCLLCWYQRICLYPLVVVFGVGLMRDEKSTVAFAAPLVVLGILIAAYHCLLYYGIIPESIAPCKQGVSCTTKQVEYFGFITIPLLSLFAFSTLAVLLIGARNSSKGSS